MISNRTIVFEKLRRRLNYLEHSLDVRKRRKEHKETSARWLEARKKKNKKFRKPKHLNLKKKVAKEKVCNFKNTNSIASQLN